VLPQAIITILVVYCLKDISFVNAPFGIPELIAVAIVVLLQWWKENTLLSIFVPTVIYMLLLQVM
ncbi:MAG: AzlD domain-containing protein, partial [Streptococcus sp.]|nr:AzlD domain-containing protein [Streptococcus sp.]